MIVHARDADEDTADILEDEMGKGDYQAYPLLHGWTKGSRGAHLISAFIFPLAVLPFKNATDLRETIKAVPFERLLMDRCTVSCPSAASRQAQQAFFVADTAAMLAELKGVSTEELARITSDNFSHILQSQTTERRMSLSFRIF